jgi:hypothetical protein
MRFSKLIRVCALCGLTLSVALAQQPMTPADAGSTPSTFRSYVVVDQRTDAKDPQNRTGKQHDLVSGNALNPTLAVFASTIPKTADEPLAKLIQRVKAVQDTYKGEQFGAFVIFAVLEKDYTADAKADDKAKEIATWASATPPGGVVLGLAKMADGKPGDAMNWGLAPETTTVVFYNRHKLIKRWDLKDAGITDEMLNSITAEADKEMKKK